MKWPCPNWFHVPTKTEWQTVCWILVTTFSLPATNAMVETYLKLPQCWYRWKPNYVNSNTAYLSCTITSIGGSPFAVALKYDGTINYNNALWLSTSGYPIRSFKNTAVIPDNTWATLYDWSSIASWAWVFHNATLWLISVSGDGTTWTTMADKNVWAINAYNTWDTKSESNCGKLFQWWNNYWFSRTWSITTSNTQVDASNYWPWNYYYSSTFITWTSGNKWDSSDNDNLRWWATQWTFQDGEKISAINTTQADVDSTAPSNPLTWQIWYDTANSVLKIYDWNTWQTV